jgi:hypothetical protein
MKLASILVAAVAIAIPAANASSRSTASPPQATTMYAHVKSVRRSGNRWLMRVDPALWLTGITAYRAALEDGAIKPGEAVANDYYIRDSEHRLLTYLVAANAPITVLTRHGQGAIPTQTIDVAELAQIIKGKNPKHRGLLEPKAGFWLRLAGDRTVALDQQYQP